MCAPSHKHAANYLVGVDFVMRKSVLDKTHVCTRMPLRMDKQNMRTYPLPMHARINAQCNTLGHKHTRTRTWQQLQCWVA